jgi:hypothetical protein
MVFFCQHFTNLVFRNHKNLNGKSRNSIKSPSSIFELKNSLLFATSNLHFLSFWVFDTCQLMILFQFPRWKNQTLTCSVASKRVKNHLSTSFGHFWTLLGGNLTPNFGRFSRQNWMKKFDLFWFWYFDFRTDESLIRLPSFVPLGVSVWTACLVDVSNGPRLAWAARAREHNWYRTVAPYWASYMGIGVWVGRGGGGWDQTWAWGGGGGGGGGPAAPGPGAGTPPWKILGPVYPPPGPPAPRFFRALTFETWRSSDVYNYMIFISL